MWRFLFRHTVLTRLNTRVVRRVAYIGLFGSLLFSGCAEFLYAQSVQMLHGEVEDALTHLPVLHATIRIANTSFFTHTDQFGQFTLSNLPIGGYELVISADGYTPDTIHGVILTADQPTTVSCVLQPIVHELPSIEVHDSLTHDAIDGRIVISKETIKQSHATSLTQILTTIPGIIVQETGPQQVTVSLRGGEKRHLLVLLDGQKLNTSGDNIANLASIPLSIVESIEILPGGNSAESGSGAVAGVLNIVTHGNTASQSRQLSLRQGWGSWEGNSHDLIVENPVPVSPMTYRFSYAHQGAEGNFPFEYQVAPRPTVYSGTRTNNAVSSDNYFLTGEAAVSQKTNLNLSGQYYHAASGLPGKASAQNETANRVDSRLMLSSQLRTELSSRFAITASFGGSRLQQQFTNRESGATGFETEYTNDIYQASLASQYHPFSKTELHFGVETELDKVDGQDIMRPAYSLGVSNRISEAAYVSTRQQIPLGLYQYLHPFVIDAALRYDHARTGEGELFHTGDSASNTEQWSPKIGAGIGVGTALQFTLYGSYGRSFSLPDLYSLFWKGDVRSQGNPYLRPEKAEHSDLTARVSYEHRLASISGSVSYFHSYVHDLIVWLAGFGDVWRPENIAGARITGTEETATLMIYKHLLDISASHTEIQPLNRTPGTNSFNKDLTYRPRTISKLSARVSRFGLYASYGIRWVDRSYALASNTKWYEGYRLDDVAFGGEQTLWQHWNLHTDVRIDNLRNINYVLVQHYPMPGREWQFHIGLDYFFIPKHSEQKSQDK